MKIELVELSEKQLEQVTVQEYYQMNLDKLQKEDHVVVQGKLTAVLDAYNQTVEFQAFVLKDGFIVVDDWGLLEEVIMAPIPASECYFSDGKNKVDVFLDEDTELKCDFPGVNLNKNLKDRINQVRQEQNNNKKAVEEPQKYKL